MEESPADNMLEASLFPVREMMLILQLFLTYLCFPAWGWGWGWVLGATIAQIDGQETP